MAAQQLLSCVIDIVAGSTVCERRVATAAHACQQQRKVCAFCPFPMMLRSPFSLRTLCTYGLLSTAMNVRSSVVRALANQMYGCWQPSASAPANFGADSDEFRRVVLRSDLASHGVGLASLALLLLLPDQRAQTRRRLRELSSHNAYSAASVALLFGC